MCLPSLAAAIEPLRTRQLLLFPFWRVPAFPCSGNWAAPHTSALAFSFPACACLPLQRRLGRSAHVSSCFFLSGVCLPSLTEASGPLRTRQLLLFPFWRVPAFPCSGDWAAPHTSALAFSFLACACLLWDWRLGCSAHVSFFFFLSGVCLPSLTAAIGPLRTRQLLLFPFWRVPAFPCRGVRAAPHTSAFCFFFPACACLPLRRRQGRSAHVSSCLFLFGVCLPSLAAAIGPLRTRQLLLFSFRRVPAFPCRGVRAAPHTSALAFSFPACACLLHTTFQKNIQKSITFFLHDYHPLVTI